MKFPICIFTSEASRIKFLSLSRFYTLISSLLHLTRLSSKNYFPSEFLNYENINYLNESPFDLLLFTSHTSSSIITKWIIRNVWKMSSNAFHHNQWEMWVFLSGICMRNEAGMSTNERRKCTTHKGKLFLK
jgi:hypothetical protein